MRIKIRTKKWECWQHPHLKKLLNPQPMATATAMFIKEHDNQNVKFQVSVFSGYLKVKSPFKLQSRRRTMTKRGKIKGFSYSSRYRLMKKLFSLSQPPTHFITLTYPSEYPSDSRKWKRDLDVFSKALLRTFPKSWFIWKLEPQKRGAPHFHLIGCFGAQVNLKYLYQWVSKVWYRIVGSGDEKHFRAGTQVKFLDSKKKILKYVSKYIGKCFSEDSLPKGWESPGRYWGIVGRQNFPPPKLICHTELKVKEVIELKRFLRKWLHSIARNSKNLEKVKKFSEYITKTYLSFSVFISFKVVVRFLLFSLKKFNLYFDDSGGQLLF